MIVGVSRKCDARLRQRNRRWGATGSGLLGHMKMMTQSS